MGNSKNKPLDSGSVTLNRVSSGYETSKRVSWQHITKHSCPVQFTVRYWRKNSKHEVQTNATWFMLECLLVNSPYWVTVEVISLIPTPEGVPRSSTTGKMQFYTGNVSMSVTKLSYADSPGSPVITFKAIPELGWDLFSSYKITVKRTVTACNETTTEVVQKQPVTNADGLLEIKLPTVSKKHSASTEVTVQPLFGDKVGKIATDKSSFDHRGKTKIVISDNILSRNREITVVPYQTDISCEPKMVNFTIKGHNVKGLFKNISKIGNNQFKITDLVPGRKYFLKAKSIYLNNEEDDSSESIMFETADEISTPITNHVAKIGETFRIRCSADVGPADQFAKTIDWRRSDESPLPAGARSQTDPDRTDVAYLVIENAQTDHSGSYRCFVKPAAAVGRSAEVVVIVNDLSVEPALKQVDFSTANLGTNPVQVKCSTLVVNADTKLGWLDNTGQDLVEGTSSDGSVSVKTTRSKDSGMQALLTFNKISLANAGVYRCSKNYSGISASLEFKLYGTASVKISRLAKSSSLLGEQTLFRCEGEASMPGDSVVWETQNMKSQTGEQLMVASYPNEANKLVQELKVTNNFATKKVTCRLVTKASMKAKAVEPIKLKQEIKTEMTKTELTVGDSMQISCIGYPDKSGMDMKLVFYANSELESTNALVLMTESQKQSHEPISLKFIRDAVFANSTGKYECVLADAGSTKATNPKESASEKRSSLNIVINPVSLESKKTVDGSSNNQNGKGVSTISPVPALPF